MAELKTKRNRQSVTAFLNQIPDARRRRDARAIAAMMRDITKAKPEMWGTSIAGFGSYHLPTLKTLIRQSVRHMRRRTT